MEIIQSFYYSQNASRQIELEHALTQNLSKIFIDHIHLFITDNDYNIFIKSNYINNENFHKIIFAKFENQPTYPQLFTYCSKMQDKICCICNSDIEFNISNENLFLIEKLRNNKLMYFLTRHEYNMKKPLIDSFGGSHDAFIFHSDMLNVNDIDLSYINYIQNTVGIEALLTIFFIERLQFQILNPCLQIILIHHHNSNVRIWSHAHKPPVGYTHATLETGPGVHNRHMIIPKLINM